MDGQGTKWLRKIAEIYNRLKVHERYRHTTDDRQTDTDGRQHIAIVNVSSRSLKMCKLLCLDVRSLLCPVAGSDKLVYSQARGDNIPDFLREIQRTLEINFRRNWYIIIICWKHSHSYVF